MRSRFPSTVPPQTLPLSLQLRDVLFGDMPPDRFPPPGTGNDSPEPTGTLAAARDAAAAGQLAEAIRLYRSLLASPMLESRARAQIWHALRGLGVATDPDELVVLGAVAEAGINGGLDIVAAYRDGTARYVGHSDAMIAWESPGADAAIATGIDRLLTAAERLAAFAGPHDGRRPGPPPQGHVRLTAIVTDGLHFGQAPMEVFMNDAVAAPFLAAAIELMQMLMDCARRRASD